MGAVSFTIDLNLVKALKKIVNIENFVETGTYKGESLQVVMDHFKNIYSIELSPILYAEAFEVFKDAEKVNLLVGDSSLLLKDVVNLLNGKDAVFWLDAHWCAASDTAGEKSQCPLLHELDSIGILGKDSVVLIDDARLFLSIPPAPHEVSDWPSFDELSKKLRQIGHEHKLMVTNDVIILYPEVMEKDLHEYARVYGVDWLRAAQAYLELIVLDNELEARLSTIDSLNNLLKKRDALHHASIADNSLLNQEIDNLKLSISSRFSLLKLLIKSVFN